ncbi:hypothetical protein PEC730217_20280 [Pectobacterium carotovorum subsp. carotovorum]|nr:hypothetical protein [Pectobacterium carotovorum subsp. carotovorum]PVY72735.1 hypothetical protein C7330_1854 [Pectobacterium versatile]GKV83613.1 hypothetical protein PEC106664_43870 [Pectobacterium carotovorum subsp. carotovorum]GKW33248.1 hypothetical protein PEC730217_20280 [Pectobacterium carotovorum subsp. carotovorum]
MRYSLKTFAEDQVLSSCAQGCYFYHYMLNIVQATFGILKFIEHKSFLRRKK